MKLRKPDSDSEKVVGPFLNKYIQDKKIENLGIDFTAVATNLRNGREVYINKGSLLKAVLASMCLPGIFHPVEISNKLLIDGGVVDPLPQNYGFIIARKVIAVNAMPKKISYKIKNNGIFEVLSEASGIVSNTLLNLENLITLQTFKDEKGIFLQLKTENRKPFDFYNISELINIGRKETKKNIKKIIEFVRDD
jgi:NTE family protein